MIQIRCDCFNNNPHLGLSTICCKAIDFVPSIINNYDVLKLKSFFKHNDLASECSFHNFFNLQ